MFTTAYRGPAVAGDMYQAITYILIQDVRFSVTMAYTKGISDRRYSSGYSRQVIQYIVKQAVQFSVRCSSGRRSVFG